MKTPAIAILAAALAATPATAETYLCRSDRGAEVAVQAAGNRLAIDDGKLRTLCGRGGDGRCTRTDSGYAYAGPAGTIAFVPASPVFRAPPALRVRAPGEATTTNYFCRVADARVARRFGR